MLLSLIWAVPCFTQEIGDPSCETAFSAAWTDADGAWTEYSHGALQYFNYYFRFLNGVVLADPENVLCHFKKSMGIDPVAVGTHTKTFGASTINVVIETPGEAWATDYTYKGSVYVGAVSDSNWYMSIWWAGNATSSKGYLITGAKDLMGGTEAMLNYIRWDNTSTDQIIKVYMTHLDTTGTYLQTAASSTSDGWGDMALYGGISYNSSTKAVTVQQVMIENQRVSSGGTNGQWGCFRMIAVEPKNGTITAPTDARGGTGHATNNATTAVTTANQMDAVTLVDATTTANGTGALGRRP